LSVAAMAEFYRLLHSKYHPPALSEETFSGKTVLITGGTSGLGLEAAKKIAALDAWTIIITARDQAKGEIAKEEIEFACRERAMDELDIQVWPLDMSDFSSVKNFADRVNKELPRLDVVILNAGQTNRLWSKVSDANGPWEMTLMVNTLATIFLALLLLPKLLSTVNAKGVDPTDPPHLNFISSGSVTGQKPENYSKYEGSQNVLEAVSKEDAYAGGRGQYAMSKLFLEYGMRRIASLPSVAKESGEKTVIVNSTCPGMVKTDLGRSWASQHLIIRFLIWLLTSIFARSADHGSRSYVSGVTLGVDGHGKMWKNDKYRE
jgi:NAD(P)-dependent dehydrogenase (short-subunit alcohol dehydrogenase family)